MAKQERSGHSECEGLQTRKLKAQICESTCSQTMVCIRATCRVSKNALPRRSHPQRLACGIWASVFFYKSFPGESKVQLVQISLGRGLSNHLRSSSFSGFELQQSFPFNSICQFWECSPHSPARKRMVRKGSQATQIYTSLQDTALHHSIKNFNICYLICKMS